MGNEIFIISRFIVHIHVSGEAFKTILNIKISISYKPVAKENVKNDQKTEENSGIKQWKSIITSSGELL